MGEWSEYPEERKGTHGAPIYATQEEADAARIRRQARQRAVRVIEEREAQVAAEQAQREEFAKLGFTEEEAEGYITQERERKLMEANQSRQSMGLPPLDPATVARVLKPEAVNNREPEPEPEEREQRPAWNTEPVQGELPKRVQKVLDTYPDLNVSALKAMPDAALKGLKGVGPAILKEIREL